MKVGSSLCGGFATIALIVAAVTLMFTSGALANTYPLALLSSRARFELLDAALNTVTEVSHIYYVRTRSLRYSWLDAANLTRRTSVTSLLNWTRYTFDGVYSDACEALPPPTAPADLAQAVAVLAACGAASSNENVAPLVTEAGASTTRGIATRRWVARGAVLAVGAVRCNVDFAWDVDVQRVVEGEVVTPVPTTLRRFTVDGACGAIPIALRATVVAFVNDATRSDLFRPIGTCNSAAPPSAPSPTSDETTPAPTLATPFPMPTLPTEFSAVIETTLVERQFSFTQYETYSWPLRAARSTMVFNDGARSVVVSGQAGLAYTMTGSRGLIDIDEEPVSAAGFSTRTLFDSSATCVKEVFTMQLLGDVHDLLLRTLAGGPKYMGRVPVRDIPAKAWSATVGSLSIAWYFQDLETAPAVGNASASSRHFIPQQSGESGVGGLLRITAVGAGQSPFVSLHPFLQRGVATPEAAVEACRAALPYAAQAQCRNQGAVFHHIYDFTTFLPVADAAEIVPPSACVADGGSSVAVYPVNASNCPEGTSKATIFGMMLFASLFGGIIAASAMYLRMLNKQAAADAEKSDI